MSSIRLAYGSLHHHGAGLLPDDLEGVDYLLLDGGPVVAPDEEGPRGLLDEAIRRLAPVLYLNPELKVIASLAGRDPEEAAERAGAILSGTGNADLPIGVVHGSDVLDRLEEFLAAGEELRHDLSEELFARSTMITDAAAVQMDGEATIAPSKRGARITLVGYADTMVVQPTLEGVSLDPDRSFPLHILLGVGWRARVLFRSSTVAERQHLRGLAESWESALREEGVPTSAATIELLAEPGESKVIGFLATYRGVDKSKVRQSMRLLQQVGNPYGRPAEIEVLIHPQVVRERQLWPTSIPNDLVEWSVDVRPARDWVE